MSSTKPHIIIVILLLKNLFTMQVTIVLYIGIPYYELCSHADFSPHTEPTVEFPEMLLKESCMKFDTGLYRI